MTIPEAIQILEDLSAGSCLTSVERQREANGMAACALGRVQEARRETARGIARKLPGETLPAPRNGYD